MYENHENIFYYITVMNEIYTHPEMPAGTQEGIIRGIYPLKKVGIVSGSNDRTLCIS
jgi:pyruvate dehydrogenase E1 component